MAEAPSARLIVPFFFSISVIVFIRYGCYADCRMILGPGSSRLVQTNSVFVQRIDIRGDGWNEAFLYEFSEKPELSCVTNWSIADSVIVPSYSSKDFVMWLNKGSHVKIRWESHTNSFNQLQLVISRGERILQTLQPKEMIWFGSANGPKNGNEAEFTVHEDDKYSISFINTKHRNTIMSVNVNVLARMYNITKAKSSCSTLKERCQIKLFYPHRRYIVVMTPENSDHNGWYIGISFAARIISYFAILGVMVIVIFVIAVCLPNCNNQSDEIVIDDHQVAQVAETVPILGPKQVSFIYETNDDEEWGFSSTSSEDLYDERLCIICCDSQRNCFFIPCGHCATCYDCTKRIVDETKSCPVCRSMVHKVRAVFSA